jgi:hypothetical protein
VERTLRAVPHALRDLAHASLLLPWNCSAILLDPMVKCSREIRV